jgi:hypothetical protein
MPKLPPRVARPELEADVSANVRKMLASDGEIVHWRNNVGTLPDPHRPGAYVTYGLAVGSSDLIACVPTSLRCPHCDCLLPPIGRFVGIETKRPSRSVTSADQTHWIGIVNAAHGVAGTAKSVLEAEVIVATARAKW